MEALAETPRVRHSIRNAFQAFASIVRETFTLVVAMYTVYTQLQIRA